jgi:repressor of nif and glnA expression
MNENPLILHIDVGNQSVKAWLKEHRYVIYSEIVRYCEKLLNSDLESIQAILVSNISDNVVFLIEREHIGLALDKAMNYFITIEEYEQCAKIRDLQQLL